MKFYEFNEHEYYALIQAIDEESAYEEYVEFVGGDTVEDIKLEGKPTEITALEALLKLGSAISDEDSEVPVSEVLDILFNTEIPLKLIDGDLA